MLNVIALMGRLTREPELRVTPGGTSVCTVTLAVERDYVERGGERETDYIDVVSWGKTAEFVARYFRKGLLVGCQGRLQTRKWRDRYEQSRTAVEVVSGSVYFAERAEREDTGRAAVTPARAGSRRDDTPESGTAARGWNPDAANVTPDAYAGDLYREAADDRPEREYGGLPQSDFAGIEDEDIPF